jgi:hypothetical protein
MKTWLERFNFMRTRIIETRFAGDLGISP